MDWTNRTDFVFALVCCVWLQDGVKTTVLPPGTHNHSTNNHVAFPWQLCSTSNSTCSSLLLRTGARYKFLEQLYVTRDQTNVPVRFTPAFAKETTTYECTVPFDVTALVVSPFPERKVDAMNVTLKVSFSDATHPFEPGNGCDRSMRSAAALSM